MTVKELREALETLPDGLDIIFQYGPHYYLADIRLKPGEYKKYQDRLGGWFESMGKLNSLLINMAVDKHDSIN